MMHSWYSHLISMNSCTQCTMYVAHGHERTQRYMWRFDKSTVCLRAFRVHQQQLSMQSEHFHSTGMDFWQYHETEKRFFPPLGIQNEVQMWIFKEMRCVHPNCMKTNSFERVSLAIETLCTHTMTRAKWFFWFFTNQINRSIYLLHPNANLIYIIMVHWCKNEHTQILNNPSIRALLLASSLFHTALNGMEWLCVRTVHTEKESTFMSRCTGVACNQEFIAQAGHDCIHIICIPWQMQ